MRQCKTIEQMCKSKYNSKRAKANMIANMQKQIQWQMYKGKYNGKRTKTDKIANAQKQI